MSSLAVGKMGVVNASSRFPSNGKIFSNAWEAFAEALLYSSRQNPPPLYPPYSPTQRLRDGRKQSVKFLTRASCTVTTLHLRSKINAKLTHAKHILFSRTKQAFIANHTDLLGLFISTLNTMYARPPSPSVHSGTSTLSSPPLYEAAS